MLPEKWVIRITEENKNIVGAYYDKKTDSQTDPTYGTSKAVGRYLYSHETNGNHCYIGADKGSGSRHHYASFFCRSTDAPEITTEQFIRCVLKQEPKEAIYEIY